MAHQCLGRWYLHTSEAELRVCHNMTSYTTLDDVSPRTSLLQHPVRCVNNVHMPFGHWPKRVWTESDLSQICLQSEQSLGRAHPLSIRDFFQLRVVGSAVAPQRQGDTLDDAGPLRDTLSLWGESGEPRENPGWRTYNSA